MLQNDCSASPAPCHDWEQRAKHAPRTPPSAVESCMRAAFQRSNPARSRMAKSPTFKERTKHLCTAIIQRFLNRLQASRHPLSLHEHITYHYIHFLIVIKKRFKENLSEKYLMRNLMKQDGECC